LISACIEIRHAHTAKADCGNTKAPELTHFHRFAPSLNGHNVGFASNVSKTGNAAMFEGGPTRHKWADRLSAALQWNAGG
ncbi:MAG: hypothetical protein M0Z85_10090, partial [Gammaproteobacteria bacterium]|nr:hypothetical protein [Gammaproteobacteria bacterium]